MTTCMHFTTNDLHQNKKKNKVTWGSVKICNTTCVSFPFDTSVWIGKQIYFTWSLVSLIISEFGRRRWFSGEREKRLIKFSNQIQRLCIAAVLANNNTVTTKNVIETDSSANYTTANEVITANPTTTAMMTTTSVINLRTTTTIQTTTIMTTSIVTTTTRVSSTTTTDGNSQVLINL